jgi:hypothetical protein
MRYGASIGRWVRAGSIVALLLLMILPQVTFAADKKTEKSDPITQSVTQSFVSDKALQKGMLVELTSKNSNKVITLKQEDADLMEGVVVDATQSSITLSDDSTSARLVYVAPYGRYPVLVSTQNGPIKKGDYLAVSALDGVAMKVDAEQSIVIGKADSDFSGTGSVAGTATLTDSNGKEKSVALGRVTTNIVISHNPFQQKGGNTLPGVLQRVSKGIASKPVSVARVYLGLAVLLITAFVAGSLLFAGVRAGLTAIGRNPLAKRSIIRAMIQATLTSLIVFVLGLFAVYLVLKL